MASSSLTATSLPVIFVITWWWPRFQLPHILLGIRNLRRGVYHRRPMLCLLPGGLASGRQQRRAVPTWVIKHHSINYCSICLGSITAERDEYISCLGSITAERDEYIELSWRASRRSVMSTLSCLASITAERDEYIELFGEHHDGA